MNKVILVGIIYCLMIIQIGIVSHAERILSKLDFAEDSDKELNEDNESTKIGDDVEVKHTIVVTTKLKNNNPMANQESFRQNPTTFVNSGNIRPPHRRRGYDVQAKSRDDDSEEVPVIKGYKGVETTETRFSGRSDLPDVYPDLDSVVIVANVDRDKVSHGINPADLSSGNQWRPSIYFKNINNYDQTPEYFHYDVSRTKGLNSRNMPQGSIAASSSFLTPQGAEEPWEANTYCCKCRRGGSKHLVGWDRPMVEMSTKASVDGRIAKPFN